MFQLFNFVFGGLGAAIILAGVWLLIRRRRFIATANRTDAKVVAYDKRQNLSNDEGPNTTLYYYHPIVEFSDDHGTLRRVKSRTGTPTQGYPIGAAVKVLY